VQTFDEERFLSAKPATEEQQAFVNQVFSQIKNEVKIEEETLLNAKRLKSKILLKMRKVDLESKKLIYILRK
jgi:hypothetical protein